MEYIAILNNGQDKILCENYAVAKARVQKLWVKNGKTGLVKIGKYDVPFRPSDNPHFEEIEIVETFEI